MTTRFGDAEAVDLARVLAWGRRAGVRLVVLPVVQDEAAYRLFDAVEGAAPRANPYERRRLYGSADHRLEGILGSLDRADPPWQQEELDEARKRFEAEPRDLGALLGGRAKNPIPDPNDLQIMVQARKLAGGATAFVISNDAHFWGYEDRLAAWWGLGVVRTGLLPEMLREWDA